MDIKNLGVNKRRTERTLSRPASPSAGTLRKGGAEQAAASQDESIELTAMARALSAAQADAANAPFNAERVQEIRDAIAEGRYPINNRRLADRLIELEGLLD